MRKELELNQSTFAETLEGIAFGTAAMNADRKLKKCVEASAKTGKMSTITITLKIKPVMGQDVMQFEISDQCRANIPEAEHSATLMYGNEDSQLSLEHPAIVAKKAKIKASEAAKLAAKGENVKIIKGVKS